ncbi:MAG TPA: energy transducer TonB [Thermoanaerobaculia bacterium]|jgi:TonB family protein|nr:energy transducer TonB [Thermoanaerobaculia bacterium]
MKNSWTWLILAAGLCLAALSARTFATSWQVKPVAVPRFQDSAPPQTNPEKLLEPPQDEWPLRVTGAVTRPVFLDGAKPYYFKRPFEARVQGKVIAEATIDEQGRVADVRVLKGLPMGMDVAAVEAMKTWRFKPATLNGKAVRVYYTLTVDFNLPR